LRLTNPGPGPIVVKRIEMMVARFGMGVAWEELPALGPLHLPEDPNHIEEVSVEWTPTEGGHRCVRAAIHIDSLPQPLQVGRNLEVLESTGERSIWRVPFRLGNPTDERAPVFLQVKGGNPEAVEAHVRIGRFARDGQPVWLNAKEEVDAELVLRAQNNAAIESVHTVEAILGGKLLDGIQVEVHCPVRASRKLEREIGTHGADMAMTH